MESSSVAARLRIELDIGIWAGNGCGLEGIGGGSESDDCASSSENGLVCSGLVVLCASDTVEPGRGGITGFDSVKLCRGL